ncbi:MAG: hypothetical protein WBW62_11635 [Solirubrobacterales bacterium]
MLKRIGFLTALVACAAMCIGVVVPAVSPSLDSAQAKKRKGTKIIRANSQFGKIIFDGKRQAIYLFDSETSRKPKCYGACARAWPPVLAKGKPFAGKGVRSKLIKTTKRRGGAKQVTYAGHPLYYYAHEPPRAVFCHNVFSYGGLWKVLHPGGKPER